MRYNGSMLTDTEFEEKLKLFGKDTFVLTEQHIRLLRSAYVDWNDVEWGAPSIDPKRPYGNGDVIRDIWEELEPDGEWDDDYGLPRNMTPEEWHELREAYETLHRETETALQVILSTGSFEPGRYVSPSYFSTEWRRDAG